MKVGGAEQTEEKPKMTDSYTNIPKANRQHSALCDREGAYEMWKAEPRK